MGSCLYPLVLTPRITDHLHSFKNIGLLVSDVFGIKGNRSFHGEQGQHLYQVVLNHIPDNSCAVEIGPSGFHSDLLGGVDLYGFDVGGIPQGIEKAVGEAENQQILNRLFSQVVIDTVDSIFFEVLREAPVQFPGALEIVTEGFLDDNPGLATETLMMQGIGCIGVYFRRQGKKDDDGFENTQAIQVFPETFDPAMVVKQGRN